MSTTPARTSFPSPSQSAPNGSFYNGNALKTAANASLPKTAPDGVTSRSVLAVSNLPPAQEYMQQKGRTDEEKEIMKATASR